MHRLPRQPRRLLRKRQESHVPFKDAKLEHAARRFVLASMTSLVAMDQDDEALEALKWTFLD